MGGCLEARLEVADGLEVSPTVAGNLVVGENCGKRRVRLGRMPRVDEKEERTLVLLKDESKQSSAVAFSDQTASETDVVAGGRSDEGQRLSRYYPFLFVLTYQS